MPPKNQYTKEQILEAALEIVKEEGISKITMRKIAAKLGCSVAPLYVNFKSGDDLLEAIYEEIAKLAWSYSTKPYTDFGFFNIGIGQVLFARDFPQLYKELLQINDHCFHMNDLQRSNMIEIMSKDSMISDLSREQLGGLLEKMAYLTAGISLSVVTGSTIEIEEVLQVMEETAHHLIFAMDQGAESPKIIQINLE